MRYVSRADALLLSLCLALSVAVFSLGWYFNPIPLPPANVVRDMLIWIASMLFHVAGLAALLIALTILGVFDKKEKRQ